MEIAARRSRSRTVRKRPSKDGPMMYVVALLLIASSFFLGTLVTKVQILEERQGVQAQVPQGADAQPTPAIGDVPEVTKRDHVRGSTHPTVVMIEYSDFECPYCKMFQATMKQILSDYGDKVQWVYRDFPLSIHANAQKEAEAGECAYDQGGNDAFWKFADAIYEKTQSNGTGFALDRLSPLAAEIGLNPKTFQDCLDSGTFTQYVKDSEAAGTKAGIQGTPGTVVINVKTGKKGFIPGALQLSDVKQVVDSVLQ